MPSLMPADAVLDRFFLEMRCKIIDLGAALDRIDQAADAPRVRSDPRIRQLEEAIQVLIDRRPERAGRILMLFSDEYQPDWPRPVASR